MTFIPTPLVLEHKNIQEYLKSIGCPTDEYYLLKKDIKRGRYEAWINKYPDQIVLIFASYLKYAHLSVKGIRYFIKHGLDIDAPSYAYGEFAESPLSCSFNNRCIGDIIVLLKSGADVNYLNQRGWSYLDDLLFTCEVEDKEQWGMIAEVLLIYIEYGLQNVILDYPFSIQLSLYIPYLEAKKKSKTSRLVREFLLGCSVINLKERLKNEVDESGEY